MNEFDLGAMTSFGSGFALFAFGVLAGLLMRDFSGGHEKAKTTEMRLECDKCGRMGRFNIKMPVGWRKIVLRDESTCPTCNGLKMGKNIAKELMSA